MKKIYLYAVTLSTVFFACSTDALVEDYSATDMVYKTKTQSSLIDLITTLESACRGMIDTDTEKLIDWVEQQAFTNEDFSQLARQGYSSPTLSELNYILDADIVDIINELSYSSEVKEYLYAMLIDKQPFSESFLNHPLLSHYEQQLLEICRLFNENGDDDWEDKRPLAFAYGYQTSEANAVIMAVILSKN